MALKKCPRCGEYYSDTYKECPFCDEEDYDEYRPRRRRGGGGLLGVVLILVAVLVIGFVAWSLFGTEIQAFVQDRTGTHQTDGGTTSSETGSATGSETGSETGGTTGSETGTSDPDGAVKPGTGETAGGAAADIVLAKADVTLSAGESFTLAATGGDGTDYAFDSEDPGVASVDSAGKVTAIAAGTTNVTVTSGGKSAQCIVRVKGTAGGSAAGTSSAQPTSANAALNREDVTMSVGESFKLTVTGGTASSWAVGKSSVAAVDGSGKVTAVASGTTTVTATLSSGSKLKCIVRVK